MFSRKQVEENLRAKNRALEEKLETVREFVLSRRGDIESDMENFGMLRPLLEYFTGSGGAE